MSEIQRRAFLAGLAASRALRAASPAVPQRAQNLDGRLNLIEIVVDTWSAHYIGAYGHGNVETPSADALAAESTMFLDCYSEILPTVPVRRVLSTGRRAFPGLLVDNPDDPRFRGWHSLFVEDVTLSEQLRSVDYRTALVADNYHFWKPGKNFGRGFDAVHWIRGQEQDRYATGPREGIDIARFLHPSQLVQENAGLLCGLTTYLIARQQWKTEDDWPTARLFSQAADWLDQNVGDRQPFYLHIESYSPHEFWDPPEDYYQSMMRAAYSGPRLIHPPDSTGVLSPAEIAHFRALYLGMVRFVDTRLGQFLSHVEELGLMENTIIVLTSDHGTFQGERGDVHKSEGLLRTQLTKVPLLVFDPRQSAKKIGGLVQHTDICPTLLDLLNVEIPGRITGRSLRRHIESGENVQTDYIVGGWDNHGFVRTPEWNYIDRWNPGETYLELYDTREDPIESINVVDHHPAIAADLRNKLMRYIRQGRDYVQGTWTHVLDDPFGASLP